MTQENKKITETKAFLWTSICFGAAFLLPVITITYEYCLTSGVSFDFGIDGWVNFLRLYDVPAKVVAAYLAVVGLIGLNHRSEQTKNQIDISNLQIELGTKQLKATTEQNKFINYFKHLEEFENYVAKLRMSSKCLGVDVRLAHNSIFPDCMEQGNYYASRTTLKTLADLVARNVSLVIDYLEDGSKHSRQRAFQTTSKNIDSISQYAGNVNGTKSLARREGSDDLEYSKVLLRELMSEFSTLIELLIFDSTINSKNLTIVLDLLDGYSRACQPSGSPLRLIDTEHKKRADELDAETLVIHMNNLIGHLNVVSGEEPLKHMRFE